MLEEEAKTIKMSNPATMHDIAQALGVTKATVSYALSGKGRMSPQTREAVVAMARKMGFRPNPHARTLSNGRSHDTIGLFAFTLDLGVGTTKLLMLQRLLSQRGYRAPIHICGANTGSDRQELQLEAMTNLCLQRPLGIVCRVNTLCRAALEELDRYRLSGGIVVGYDVPVDLACDQVHFDREHNTYAATRHILELGHRAVALFAGWEYSEPGRLSGFRKAMKEYGLVVKPEYLLHGAAIGVLPAWEGGSNEEQGAHLVALFLKLRPRPTAICISDDNVAAAFIAELLRRGLRVPENISVVGHDDLPVGQYVSPVLLTTISQPLQAIAANVVEMLHDRITGRYNGPPRQIVLRGELIRRASSGPVAPGRVVPHGIGKDGLARGRAARIAEK